MRAERAFHQHFGAHHRIQRHVEQQPRQYCRDRRRALGVRIGQPVVQRHEPDLGAVSDQQEHEREPQHGRFELILHLIQMRPQERGAARPQHFLRGEVKQYRAEQRLRQPHAAQNEVLPRRLEALRRTVETHQQHRSERGRLHRHPQYADVVGQQSELHGESKHLVHAVIEPQPVRGKLAGVQLDAHVRAAEQRRRERDKRRQHHEEHVERVDEEILIPHQDRPVGDDARGERCRRQKSQKAHACVEFRREIAVAPDREQDAAGDRHAQYQQQLHQRSLSFSM